MIKAQVMKTILLAFMRFMSSDCYFRSIFAKCCLYIIYLVVILSICFIDDYPVLFDTCRL